MTLVNFRPAGITVETISSLVNKKETDALALYAAYFEIADWQSSWRVYATSKFMQKRLGWTKDKFHAAKKVLLELNLVSDYIDKDENGKVKKHYVTINQLTSEPVSGKTTHWENHPVENPDTSAVKESKVQLKKESALNEEDKITSEEMQKLKDEFESFRIAYKNNLKGRVRGFDIEFKNFKARSVDWKKDVLLLKPAIRKEWMDRKRKDKAGEFVPQAKNLQTWINNHCWEYEL